MKYIYLIERIKDSSQWPKGCKIWACINMLLDFTKAKVKKVTFGDLEEGQFYILDKNTDFAFGGELCIKTRDNQKKRKLCQHRNRLPRLSIQ